MRVQPEGKVPWAQYCFQLFCVIARVRSTDAGLIPPDIEGAPRRDANRGLLRHERDTALYNADIVSIRAIVPERCSGTVALSLLGEPKPAHLVPAVVFSRGVDTPSQSLGSSPAPSQRNRNKSRTRP